MNQPAQEKWEAMLPHVKRREFITKGTTTNVIQKKPFVFPVTLVAISKNGQFAVFRQEKADAKEFPLCLLHETGIAHPIRLFLAGAGSPEFLLQAEIRTLGENATGYHFTP